MIFPTISQVREKSKDSNVNRIIHNYPITKSESIKIESFLKNKKSIQVIDDKRSFETILNLFDSIFGEFLTRYENKIVFRGKLEYKGRIKDPDTGEKQIVFTVSNPKSLYRPINSKPFFIRVPCKSNLLSGIYSEITIYRNLKNYSNMFFAEPENIIPINFEAQMPSLFFDYPKFNEVFRLDYAFDLSENAQKYKRNLELSNIDLLLLNKIAGENFHDEVRGGVNCNIIKTTHDQSSYNLEVIDYFLNQITFNQNTKSVFNGNLIHCGTLNDFETTLNKNNRKLLTSPYNNYYGCNIGFSVGKTLHPEKDKFMERLPTTCVDYINPIGNLTTKSKSSVKKLLNLDDEYIFSSRILFLETQLLPIKAKVSDIEHVKPNILRMATMLKKFEDCIDDLGTDEVLPKINLTSESIDLTKKFLKNNVKDVNDFIGY